MCYGCYGILSKVEFGVFAMKPIIMNHEAVLSSLPDRPANSHKGDFGKILLLCGSRGYTGAAALAAMGALRTGAGLVYLGVPESIYAIEAVKLTEPVVFPLPDRDGKLSVDALDTILPMLDNMDTVLIGPGIGQSADVEQIVQSVLRSFRGPIVLDADGINLMKSHKDILRGRTDPTILTPHAGEFIRFGGVLTEDRLVSAADLARDLGCIVLLKGKNTVITDGRSAYVNPTGNPGMAVGGSGDVLAGILASLLGQGLYPMKAAACAAWLHGAAGDRCAEKLGQYGMIPSDMLMELPRLMK